MADGVHLAFALVAIDRYQMIADMVAAISQMRQGSLDERVVALNRPVVLFAAMSPSPTQLAVIAGEARLPDGTVRRTANFFHFNGQGRIERLSICSRSR